MRGGARGRAERRSGGDVGDVMAFFTGTIVFQNMSLLSFPIVWVPVAKGRAKARAEQRWSSSVGGRGGVEARDVRGRG
jgi:hypothetical protein